jgi:hypothetical protein
MQACPDAVNRGFNIVYGLGDRGSIPGNDKNSTHHYPLQDDPRDHSCLHMSPGPHIHLAPRFEKLYATPRLPRTCSGRCA